MAGTSSGTALAPALAAALAPALAPTIRPIRAFAVSVLRVRQLSEHFRRITFTGADLERFGPAAGAPTLDLRIKVMIPSPGHPLPDFGELTGTGLEAGWYQNWLAMEPASRGSMRTYTVREYRQGERILPPGGAGAAELDIDFVLHGATETAGTGGPAATWAAAAAPGDQLTVIGPDSRAAGCAGIEFHPGGIPLGHNRHILLAGDETAVPAISAVLESLPAGVTGDAILEVPAAADMLQLRTRSRIDVRWLVRGSHTHGELLQRAVRAAVVPAACQSGSEPEAVDVDAAILWETPQAPVGTGNGFYAWIAGEAAMVRELRRYLVRDAGVERNRVAFMGYWRLGKAERA
ncbi:siderophore-interacting protein [Paeniglutamicibacter antarcticus]|uniref:Siderophore-interacting protein n=1 Tax=Arthrobacter terrae TaxID=2935737 RepID=A0A931GBL7_9MICC|nr:siderophore-interacting protein [Arthrobacter terrae]MBG0740877.1 siderophore-interacting protein [Arthrobacter terrae]